MDKQLKNFVKHIGYARPEVEGDSQKAWDDHWRTWQAASEPVAGTANQLYDAIEQVLLHYRMSNWQDGDGAGYPLVDRLCSPDAHTIESGQHEIRLIVDEIYNEVLTKGPASAHASMTQIDDATRLDFTIDRRTTWYPGRARDKSGRGILCYDYTANVRGEAVGATMRDAIDVAMASCGYAVNTATGNSAERAAFLWHDKPENTGVGLYCQPGDRREPRWVLMFDDADRGRIVYESEQEAREAFAHAEGRGWNCWLLSPTYRAAIAQAGAAAIRGVLLECVERLEHVQGEARESVSGWVLRDEIIEKARALLAVPSVEEGGVDQRKALAKSVFGGISALRWLLNLTTEFDRKDVRTRQAARLLDEYSSNNVTNRGHLEKLWKTLHDELTLEDTLDCLNEAAAQANAGEKKSALVCPMKVVRCLKDHEIAETVNELRNIAVKFRDTQQLRERISQVIVPLLLGAEPTIAAAAAG